MLDRSLGLLKNVVLLAFPCFLLGTPAIPEAQPESGDEASSRLIVDIGGADLAGLGVNRNGLDEAVAFAEGLPRMRSLLVAKSGHLVLEEYFGGADRSTPANVKSIAKSILSAMVGIAIDRGNIEGVEERIETYFEGEYSDKVDPRMREITVEHLLTMKSGLATESNESLCPYVDSDNWVRYILGRGMAGAPDGQWVYTTANTHLLSAILTRSTGMSTLDFASEYLFDPLEIEPGDWERDPQGIYYGGNNLFLKPIDLVKFGILFLNHGRYFGRQIVAEEWVQTSTTVHADQGREWSPFHVNGYGYLWLLFRIGEYDHFAAWGHGGQFIFVIRDLDLVVVITSQWQGPSSTEHYRALSRLMEVYVVPACEGGRDDSGSSFSDR